MSDHDDNRPGDDLVDDHEVIDALLAAHALDSLDGDDQRDAERLLTEHLPGCERCQRSLPAFRSLAAELALASAPVRPPDMLLPRLQAEIRRGPETDVAARPSRPRRGVLSWLSAAAAIALIGLTVWNVALHVRVGDISSRQKKIAAVTHLITQPDARTVALESHRSEERVLLGYRETQVALFGSDVRAPEPGHVYRLWVGRDNRFEHVTDFVPEEGLVTLLLQFDASRYDQILITEEPAGQTPTVPAGPKRWSAVLGKASVDGIDAASA